MTISKKWITPVFLAILVMVLGIKTASASNCGERIEELAAQNSYIGIRRNISRAKYITSIMTELTNSSGFEDIGDYPLNIQGFLIGVNTLIHPNSMSVTVLSRVLF